MKTKAIILTVAFAIATIFTANAQEMRGRGEAQRPRMNPTEMYARMADRVAEQLKLDDEKTGLFKVLYIDYLTARQNALHPKGENGEEATKDEKMTDEKAKELLEKVFAGQEAAAKVDREYSVKFLEILTPQQTLQIFRRQGGMGQRQGQQMQQRQGGRMGGGNGPRMRGNN